MKPVKQTRMGVNGNCEACCIASILHAHLADVPQIEAHEGMKVYFRRLNAWMRDAYGIGYVCVPRGEHWRPSGWSVGGIQSDLGADFHHAVVCFNGVPVYDPLENPDNLERPVLYDSLFVVYDMSLPFSKVEGDMMPTRKWLMSFPPEFRRPFFKSGICARLDEEEYADEPMDGSGWQGGGPA